MRCVYAPLNTNLSEGEFGFEFEDLPAKLLVVAPSHLMPNNIAVRVAEKMKVPVVELIPDQNVVGIFTLSAHPVLGPVVDPGATWSVSQREDLALVLHTSG